MKASATARRLEARAPETLSERAIADLRYIRETMDAATSFTAVSGVGYVAIGVGALLTHLLARLEPEIATRILLWVGDAALSIAIGAATTVWKARRARQPIRTGPLRKFVVGIAPAIAVGAVLTVTALRLDAAALVPGLWLLLYGAGLIAAGAYSVPLLPIMGATFMLVGAVAALGPAAWGENLLVAGFAGLHVGFGLAIARRHGG
jgi:hypothetical protein